MISTPKTPKKILWVGLTRLGGALVVVNPESGYMALVGETKEPVDFGHFGLMPPVPLSDPSAEGSGAYPLALLKPQGPVKLTRPKLFLSLEASGSLGALENEASSLIARALLIRRNGSVSERLWNLVCESSPELSSETKDQAPPWIRQVEGARDFSWISTVPSNIWDIVRDTVLRCS